MPDNDQKKTEITPEAQPELRDRRDRPQGAVPKQAQTYLIVGLTLVILMAVLFSKRQVKPAPKSTEQSVATQPSEMNERQIAQLQRDLAAEQKTALQASQNAGQPLGSTGTEAATASPVNNPPQPVAGEQPQQDPIVAREKELAFQSRFASNLVGPADAEQSTQKTDATSPVNSAPPEKASADSVASAHPQDAAKRPPEVNVNSAAGQPYVLFEGTVVETVLVNRLESDFAGPVKAMVTNPVYSRDRQHVLVPEGSFLLGETSKVQGFGQKRLAVVFNRLLMPDGYSVDLDQFHGLDQIGETGLKDKVNSHYLQIFGASIALGIISGAAEATTNGGYEENGSDMYRQGMASSLSQSSANVLDRFINIPPTITIREGHRIKVYLTQDLLLPAYENHRLSPDI